MSSELTAALEQLIDRYENTGTLTGHSVAWDLRATLDAALSRPPVAEPYRCGGPQTGQPRPHDRCNCTVRAEGEK